VREHATQPFTYPMFAFAAYTGARRSDILRSLVDDFDFEQRLVRIREKKRKKDLASSTRFVPLNQHLGLADLVIHAAISTKSWYSLSVGRTVFGLEVQKPLRLAI